MWKGSCISQVVHGKGIPTKVVVLKLWQNCMPRFESFEAYVKKIKQDEQERVDAAERAETNAIAQIARKNMNDDKGARR